MEQSIAPAASTPVKAKVPVRLGLARSFVPVASWTPIPTLCMAMSFATGHNRQRRAFYFAPC